MRRAAEVCAVILCAAAMLLAQGGPGRGQGGPGHGAGFGGGMGWMAAWPDSGATVTGAPYSAVQITKFQRSLADGNEIAREDQVRVYRDSQGRVRMERIAANANTPVQARITIVDPVAGYSYMLVPGVKKAFKTQWQAGTGPRSGGCRNCGRQVQTEELGAQSINGLAATGTRTTTTIPAGAIGNAQPIQSVREIWTSTALKVPIQIKTADPRLGKSTTELTNVVQAEPDAALFQVPSDYAVTERPGGRRGGMRQRFNQR